MPHVNHRSSSKINERQLGSLNILTLKIIDFVYGIIALVVVSNALLSLERYPLRFMGKDGLRRTDDLVVFLPDTRTRYAIAAELPQKVLSQGRLFLIYSMHDDKKEMVDKAPPNERVHFPWSVVVGH